jgi:hypothetical protein
MLRRGQWKNAPARPPAPIRSVPRQLLRINGLASRVMLMKRLVLGVASYLLTRWP